MYIKKYRKALVESLLALSALTIVVVAIIIVFQPATWLSLALVGSEVGVVMLEFIIRLRHISRLDQDVTKEALEGITEFELELMFSAD